MAHSLEYYNNSGWQKVLDSVQEFKTNQNLMHQGWQKVEKARRKVKNFEDASYYVICSPPVGTRLTDMPNIGDTPLAHGSDVLTGFNLPSQVGTGLTGLSKIGGAIGTLGTPGTPGTSSSTICDSDSSDRSINPDTLNPSFLVNHGLDLSWTCSVNQGIYHPSAKPVYPYYSKNLNMVLYGENLVNQDKTTRQEIWNTPDPSDHDQKSPKH
jgi:hypothetical protein